MNSVFSGFCELCGVVVFLGFWFVFAFDLWIWVWWVWVVNFGLVGCCTPVGLFYCVFGYS